MPFNFKPARKPIHFKETGLLLVIVALAIVLASFGGSLRINNHETGTVQTVNKFLRTDNLNMVVKNSSFFAIMAIGETCVIITGGIDLSVGAIYCLAAVCGAMFLSYFGPGGIGAGASAVWVVPAAIVLCVGVGTLCGLLNGIGVVGL